MIALPFSFTGKLTFTPYSGGEPKDTPIMASGSYTRRSDDKYELTGAETKQIDFGGVGSAGAKALMVVYDQGTSPVMLDLGTDQVELTSGSAYLYLNPVPQSGTTEASLVSTADASLRVVVLG